MVGRIAEAGLTYVNSNMVSHWQASSYRLAAVTPTSLTSTNNHQVDSQMFGHVD